MKKILFLLLLCATTIQAQTYQNPTFGTVKTKTAPTVTTTPHLGTVETDGTISKITPENLPISTATLDSLGLKSLRESGVLDFDGLAINADPTKFDIGAGFGFISNSLTGGVTKVTWTAQTAQTTPYLATSVATYVLKDDTGTTVLQNSYPTNEQFRTHIYLGKLAHTTFTTISFVVNDPSRSFSVAGDFHDFVNSIGSINIEGNAITPNGANLNINVSAGRTYREGANFMNNRNSPNITTEPAVNATSFRNKFRNGSGGWNAVNTSTVDPNYYDDGSGILQLVANNKFTVKVVYRFGGTGTIHMDYGQVVYDDLNAADAGIANSVASDPDTKGFASRIGWIIIKQGTTSLLTSGNYKFVAADLFGVRAATSAPATTLQAAYDGSVTPQITTSTGGGAVTIRRGSAADTDTVLAVQNGSGTVTYSVKGNGEIYTAATPTATAFTHYFGETTSDGVIRPKTLADVRTEIVTTAAVNAAKTNIITGTGTTNTIPKFISAGVLGNSNITETTGTVDLPTLRAANDSQINGVNIGKGGGSIPSNVRLGIGALSSNTTGASNTAIGNGVGGSNTTGMGLTLFGNNSGNALVDTSNDTFFGNLSGVFLRFSGNNTVFGSLAARLAADGVTNLTSLTNSLIMGNQAYPLANGDTNEIVIGYQGRGLGSNTSVMGNSSTAYGRWWGNFLVGTSTNNGNIARFAGTVDANKLQLNNTPATATGTPPLLTWNSTTKNVESVPYETFATTTELTNSYALQDGTILYHSVKWFTPTGTVSTSGTTVTSVGTQFTSSMVGAKLTINGESRIITGYVNSTNVTAASAYSQNYSGVIAGSWGVYNKAVGVSSGLVALFHSTGGSASITSDGGFSASNFRGTDFGIYVGESLYGNTYQQKWSSTSDKFGTKDLGLRRNSAGVLEIYDGITATGLDANRRDLLVRNTFASKILIGTSTNDGVNDIQANGTVSSGNTTLGTSQPTANNQLTRKDYVDTALDLKANDNNVVKLTGEANQTIESDLGVLGTITATSFIKDGAVTGQLLRADGSSTVGYKVYTAIVSDSGSSTPNVTVLENTIGGTITWSDTNSGYYQATISGASFTSNKTFNQSTIVTGATSSTAYIASTTTIRFYAWNGTSTVDGSTMNIEIRVYN